jgi:hypothetical protein
MFLSIDGGDGTGKSTQIERLCRWLEQQGHAVVTCRDPGSTPLGEAAPSTIASPAARREVNQKQPKASLAGVPVCLQFTYCGNSVGKVASANVFLADGGHGKREFPIRCPAGVGFA